MNLWLNAMTVTTIESLIQQFSSFEFIIKTAYYIICLVVNKEIQ